MHVRLKVHEHSSWLQASQPEVVALRTHDELRPSKGTSLLCDEVYSIQPLPGGGGLVSLVEHARTLTELRRTDVRAEDRVRATIWRWATGSRIVRDEDISKG